LSPHWASVSPGRHVLPSQQPAQLPFWMQSQEWLTQSRLAVVQSTQVFPPEPQFPSAVPATQSLELSRQPVVQQTALSSQCPLEHEVPGAAGLTTQARVAQLAVWHTPAEQGPHAAPLEPH
jgi:hypothetical protein